MKTIYKILTPEATGSDLSRHSYSKREWAIEDIKKIWAHKIAEYGVKPEFYLREIPNPFTIVEMK